MMNQKHTVKSEGLASWLLSVTGENGWLLDGTSTGNVIHIISTHKHTHTHTNAHTNTHTQTHTHTHTHIVHL